MFIRGIFRLAFFPVCFFFNFLGEGVRDGRERGVKEGGSKLGRGKGLIIAIIRYFKRFMFVTTALESGDFLLSLNFQVLFK